MANVKIGIEVKGAKALTRALKTLGETEAPFLRQALDDSGTMLEQATRSRAPGGIASKVNFTGVKGKGGALRSVVVVKHGGAKAMEFGRRNYYRGFTNRKQKATGQKFTSKGQQAKPFMGVRAGNQAIGAVRDDITNRLNRAFEDEWTRITNEGD